MNPLEILIKEVNENGQGSFVLKETEKIAATNPELISAIGEIVRNEKEEDKQAVIYTAMVVFRLICIQQDQNQKKEEEVDLTLYV